MSHRYKHFDKDARREFAAQQAAELERQIFAAELNLIRMQEGEKSAKKDEREQFRASAKAVEEQIDTLKAGLATTEKVLEELG